MLRTQLRVAKGEVIADHGVVAAQHPLTAEAGLAILKRGGNAIDAAVAAIFAAGIAEPMMVGLGDAGQMVIYRADTGERLAIDFMHRAPQAATPDMFALDEGTYGFFRWRKVKDDAQLVGHRSVTVPSLLAGVSAALERAGTMTLA